MKKGIASTLVFLLIFSCASKTPVSNNLKNYTNQNYQTDADIISERVNRKIDEDSFDILLYFSLYLSAIRL